jgi:hypothetical protein
MTDRPERVKLNNDLIITKSPQDQEERAAQRQRKLGIWSVSMQMYVAPSIAEKLLKNRRVAK